MKIGHNDDAVTFSLHTNIGPNAELVFPAATRLLAVKIYPSRSSYNALHCCPNFTEALDRECQRTSVVSSSLVKTPVIWRFMNTFCINKTAFLIANKKLF